MMKRIDFKKIDKRNLGMILIISATSIMLVMNIIGSVSKRRERKSTEETETMMPVVPDAEDTVIPESKSEAYGGIPEDSPATEDYWSSYEDIYHSSLEEQGEESTAEDIFGYGSPQPRPETRRSAASNPYRETHEQREQRHARRQEEAIDMAERLSGVKEEDVDQEEEDTMPERIDLDTAPVRRTGVISSLDDGWDTSSGISSLDEPEDVFKEDDQRPVKCMFAKEMKIRSGQRVPVILLEDILVSGTVIPKNTHLMATCQIAERMNLELTSIEIGGRILPLGYEAYDIDGSRGIYCPDTGKGGKAARRQGRDLINTRVTGLVGGLARDVINTGAALMQSRDGEITVTVPAGYTFFIIQKKDKR